MESGRASLSSSRRSFDGASSSSPRRPCQQQQQQQDQIASSARAASSTCTSCRVSCSSSTPTLLRGDSPTRTNRHRELTLYRHQHSDMQHLQQQRWMFSEVARRLSRRRRGGVVSDDSHHVELLVAHTWSCFSKVLSTQLFSLAKRSLLRPQQQQQQVKSDNNASSLVTQVKVNVPGIGVFSVTVQHRHQAELLQRTLFAASPASCSWSVTAEFHPHPNFVILSTCPAPVVSRAAAAAASQSRHALREAHKAQQRRVSEREGAVVVVVARVSLGAYDIFSASAPHRHTNSPLEANARLGSPAMRAVRQFDFARLSAEVEAATDIITPSPKPDRPESTNEDDWRNGQPHPSWSPSPQHGRPASSAPLAASHSPVGSAPSAVESVRGNNIDVAKSCVTSCFAAAASRCSACDGGEDGGASFSVVMPSFGVLHLRHALRRVWLQLDASFEEQLVGLARVAVMRGVEKQMKEESGAATAAAGAVMAVPRCENRSQEPPLLSHQTTSPDRLRAAIKQLKERNDEMSQVAEQPPLAPPALSANAENKMTSQQQRPRRIPLLDIRFNSNTPPPLHRNKCFFNPPVSYLAERKSPVQAQRDMMAREKRRRKLAEERDMAQFRERMQQQQMTRKGVARMAEARNVGGDSVAPPAVATLLPSSFTLRSSSSSPSLSSAASPPLLSRIAANRPRPVPAQLESKIQRACSAAVHAPW